MFSPITLFSSTFLALYALGVSAANDGKLFILTPDEVTQVSNFTLPSVQSIWLWTKLFIIFFFHLSSVTKRLSLMGEEFHHTGSQFTLAVLISKMTRCSSTLLLILVVFCN